MGQIASRAQLRLSLLRWALVLVPLVQLLGLMSALIAGASANNAWFAALRKPAMMPPGVVFPIAWTLLYLLMALAAAVVANARGSRGRGLALALFAMQLALNLAWAPLVFALHRVTLGCWWIVALAVVVAATTAAFLRIRAAAGALMLPYLAWLGFAALLCFQLDRLNPDAERLAPPAPSTQISL